MNVGTEINNLLVDTEKLLSEIGDCNCRAGYVDKGIDDPACQFCKYSDGIIAVRRSIGNLINKLFKDKNETGAEI